MNKILNSDTLKTTPATNDADRARLEMALEASGMIGIFDGDLLANRVYCDSNFARIYGVDAEEALQGKPLGHYFAMMHPQDYPEALAARERMFAGRDDYDNEHRIIRSDGTILWILARGRLYRDAQGKPIRFSGICADITERKRAETALRESATQFQLFAQAMPNHFWIAHHNGQLEWFNDQMLTFTGHSHAALAAAGWARIVHDQDVALATAKWQACLTAGEAFEAELRLRRADGTYRWHIIRAVPIRGADGIIERWIGNNTDIEDQKKTSETLEILNATLEQQVSERTGELMAAEASLRQVQKMEAVGQLTGGLAHDFNNLLTGISGSLELLEARLAQGRFQELERYVSMAQQAAKRAAAVTHRLLAFSRRQNLAPQQTDVNRLAADMNDLIRRTVGPGIHVSVAATPDQSIVLADPNQLENALLNLCINARDAMQDGGRIDIAIANHSLNEAAAKSRDLPAGDYVCLSVTDTGTGMTQDVMDRAFDPFFTTKPMGQGTGLGLSMVYGFVRQSGGQVRIDSKRGEGTTIYLYLPRFTGTAAPQAAIAEETAPDSRAGADETVLLVDDEPSVRILVREVLAELGYVVLEAETGSAGLTLLQSARRIDLLITDVGLPGGMTGHQLAEAALACRPDLKILFITGYAQTAIPMPDQRHEGMYVLTKPFTLDALTARIREIITTKA